MTGAKRITAVQRRLVTNETGQSVRCIWVCWPCRHGNQRGGNHGRGHRICTNNEMERRTEHGKQQDRQEECVESGDYRSADNLGVAHDFGDAKGREGIPAMMSDPRRALSKGASPGKKDAKNAGLPFGFFL